MGNQHFGTRYDLSRYYEGRIFWIVARNYALLKTGAESSHGGIGSARPLNENVLVNTSEWR